MRFKSSRIATRVLAGGILAMFLTSCAGEDEKPNKALNVDLGTACLENFGTTLNDFFGGRSSPGEIVGLWDCAIQAVDTFTTYTKGQNQSSYTAKEVRNFLHENFLREDKIDDAFLQSVMEFKQIFVGGGVDTFTRQELADGKRVLTRFREFTLRLSPYMSLFASGSSDKNLKDSFTSEEFEEASRILSSVAFEFGQMLEQQGRGYAFRNFANFLRHLNRYLRRDGAAVLDEDSEFDKIIKNLELVGAAKRIFVGGSKNGIEPDEWARFFKTVSEFYGVWMRYRFYVHGHPLFTGEAFAQIDRIVNRSLELLGEGLAFHKDRRISQADLNPFFDWMDKNVRWPYGLTKATVLSVWSNLLENVFKHSQPRPQRRPGLDGTSLATLRSEYGRWFQIQRSLNRLAESGRRGDDDVAAESEIDRLLGDSRWMFTQDGQGRTVLNAPGRDHIYDRQSLFTLNWQRAAIRLLFLGSIRDADRKKRLVGVTAPELAELLRDYLDLAVGLGLVDAPAPGQAPEETAKKAATSLLEQATLFMPRANGDMIFNFEEAVEYANLTFSGATAGSLAFASMSDDLNRGSGAFCGSGLCEKVCLINSNRSPQVAAQCFRHYFYARPGVVFAHMPQLTTFFEGLRTYGYLNSKFRFVKALEQATRDGGFSQKPFSAGQLTKMTVLSQYVEIYVRRFDESGDGRIDYREAMAGYPVFDRILQEILKRQKSPLQGPKAARGLYTWLLDRGAPPDGVAEYADFFFWVDNESRWRRLDADRLRIVRILGDLASQL